MTHIDTLGYNGRLNKKMVCYVVPAVAAIIHGIMRKNTTSLKNSVHHLWLSLLLTGAAIFGVVDHWWNGELFFIGENIFMDILLGVAITIAVFVIWIVVVTLDKSKKMVKA
jgi:hypothetical protein